MGPFRNFRDRLPGRTPVRIVVDELGVAFAQDNVAEAPRWLFDWASVQAVRAFKRDLYVVDLLCMVFETAEREIELNEEMTGWAELVAAAEKYLPGFPAPGDWWDEVVKPAFATNGRALWGQGRAPQTATGTT